MSTPKGTVCKFCKHVYIFPCHGKRYECSNAVFVRSNGKIDYFKLSREEQVKIAKTGKLPNISNIVTAKAPEPKRRVRLEDAAPKKKKRVRN